VVLANFFDRLKHWDLPVIVSVLLWILLGVLLTVVARFVIRKMMRGVRFVQSTTPLPGVEGERADQRYDTVRAVLTSTALAFIWVFIAFGVAQAMNISLSGLVVWTTVIGGAFAFGAQQIVRDVLAGFFMFTEDQYGVGDLVDLGHASGTVEEVSLRVTRLRDAEGRVWFVPNGQIVRVANLSIDWATAVVDVPVPPSANLVAVTATLLQIGQDLRSRDDTGPLIIDDAQVLGVQDVQHDRVALRLSMKTKPTAQFAVLRAMRAALVAATNDGRLPMLGAARPSVVPDEPVPPPPSPPRADDA
jgi:moderate conductance mechanosensitive channel